MVSFTEASVCECDPSLAQMWDEAESAWQIISRVPKFDEKSFVEETLEATKTLMLP
jgi:hypothetical protein